MSASNPPPPPVLRCFVCDAGRAEGRTFHECVTELPGKLMANDEMPPPTIVCGDCLEDWKFALINVPKRTRRK